MCDRTTRVGVRACCVRLSCVDQFCTATPLITLLRVSAPASAGVAASPITAAKIWPRDLAAQRGNGELASSPSPADGWPSSRFRRAQPPVSMCVRCVRRPSHHCRSHVPAPCPRSSCLHDAHKIETGDAPSHVHRAAKPDTKSASCRIGGQKCWCRVPRRKTVDQWRKLHKWGAARPRIASTATVFKSRAPGTFAR